MFVHSLWSRDQNLIKQIVEVDFKTICNSMNYGLYQLMNNVTVVFKPNFPQTAKYLRVN